MRKIVFILAVALMAMSCDPKKWTATHDTSWYVKNITDKTLIITTSPFINADAVVSPGDSALIHIYSPFQYLGGPSYETFYDAWTGKPEQDWNIRICSNDGQLLRTWKYIDRNVAGKQLFNGKYWHFYKRTYDRSDHLTLTWVFDIVPTDIVADSPNL